MDDHLDAIRKVAARRPSLDPNVINRPPARSKRVVTDAGATREIGSQTAMTCWKAPLASICFLDREELNRVENVHNFRLTAFLKHGDGHGDQYFVQRRGPSVVCHATSACTVRRHAGAE